jgi:uncharacterized protein YggE
MKNNIFRVCLLLAFLVLVMPFATQARDQVAVTLAGNSDAEPNCTMQDTGQVSITFNSTESDLTKIAPMMDQKTKEVEALAKESGIDKLDFQSSNYSIYTNNNGSCGASSSNTYQYNGSVSFNITPAAKATDFMVLLTQKGYSANVNVSSYKQCQ